MSRNRPRKPAGQSPRPPAGASHFDLDAGIYAALTAVVEAAFGPVARLPDRCREFADMAYQFRANSETATGVHSALACLLLTVKRSLSLTGNASVLGDDELGVDTDRFNAAVGRAPEMSVDANRVLAIMVEHDSQSPFLKALITYMHGQHGGTSAAFEVLARLLPVVVEQQGVGTDWQRWHVTAQLLATTFPTQAS